MNTWRVLVPVDGSANAMRAVEQAVTLNARGLPLEVELVNVQPALRGDVTAFVPAGNVEAYHRDEGQKALAGAVAALDTAGVAHTDHILVGSPADAISELAREVRADLVLMGTHGRTGVAALVLGSVASGVIKDASVPVMLVR